MLSVEELKYLELFCFLLFVVPTLLLIGLISQGKATFSIFKKEADKPITLSKTELAKSTLLSSSSSTVINSLSESISLASLIKNETNSALNLSSEEEPENLKKLVEKAAMQLVIEYEKAQNRRIEDVSMYYAGYVHAYLGYRYVSSARQKVTVRKGPACSLLGLGNLHATSMTCLCPCGSRLT